MPTVDVPAPKRSLVAAGDAVTVEHYCPHKERGTKTTFRNSSAGMDALLGKKVGDIVTVSLPCHGEVEGEITFIATPYEIPS